MSATKASFTPTQVEFENQNAAAKKSKHIKLCRKCMFVPSAEWDLTGKRKRIVLTENTYSCFGRAENTNLPESTLDVKRGKEKKLWGEIFFHRRCWETSPESS